MTRDKCVQSAMRMRGLGSGQTVEFWGPIEVTRKISDDTGIAQKDLTSAQVLLWVTANTIREVERELPRWASQGAIFARQSSASLQVQCSEHPVLRRLLTDPETLDLESLYGRRREKLEVASCVASKLKLRRRTRRTKLHRERRRNLFCVVDGLVGREFHNDEGLEHGGPFTKQVNIQNQVLESAIRKDLGDGVPDLQQSVGDKVCQICEQIEQRTKKYLRHTFSMESHVDDEYERELEKLVEEEREIQLPPSEDALVEETWQWELALECGFVEGTKAKSRGFPQLVPIVDDLKRTKQFKTTWQMLNFNPKLWATSKFLMTVDRVEHLDQFLRPPEYVLRTETGDHILLSGMEAGEVLGKMRRATRPVATLLDTLSDLSGATTAPAMQLRAVATWSWNPRLQVELLGFSGECNFDDMQAEVWHAFLGLAARVEDEEVAVKLQESGVLASNGFVIRDLRPPEDNVAASEDLLEALRERRRDRGFLIEPSQLVQQLVALRGRQAQFSRSPLEKALRGTS
mmetsp:Transcript_129410/g.414787  ORF Transcript_129410/g.414787 Transcript_129410/m.414787 type:complete len:517 (+) Transcript_129410:368-1918(+)